LAPGVSSPGELDHSGMVQQSESWDNGGYMLESDGGWDREDGEIVIYVMRGRRDAIYQFERETPGG